MKVQNKISGVVLALLFSVLFLLPLDAQRQESQSTDLRNALEIFVEKAVHDRRDPIIIALLDQQVRIVPQLKKMLADKRTSRSVRSWIAFLPVLMKKNIAENLVPELIMALGDHYWRVRMNAANTLGSLQVKSAIGELLTILNDPEIFVRDSAEDALAKLATPDSLALLKSKLATAMDIDARRRLVALIGRLPTVEVVPALKSLLTADDAEIRRIAIYYLGQHPQGVKHLLRFWASATSPSKNWILEAVTPNTREVLSIDFLAAALDDPAPEVRANAIWLLNDIGTPAAYRCIEKFWQKQLQRDSQIIGVDTASALMVLGQNRNAAILAQSKKIIQNPEISEYLRAMAIYGLGGLSSQRSDIDLAGLVSNDNGYLTAIAAKVRGWQYQISDAATAGNIHRVVTSHYRICSDIGKSFCQRTALVMEYLHWHYHRQLAPTALENKNRVLGPATVYIFGNRRQFQNYARPEQIDWPFLQDSGAYYVPDRQEIITYTRHNRQFIFRTLFHETWHQIFNRYVAVSPLWLNEGLAEYYSHISQEDGFYRSGQLARRYIRLIKKNLVAGEYTPLEYLVQLDQYSFHNDRFGPEEFSHYAQSWSLIYFFYHADNGAYRPILQKYIARLQRGAQPVLALLEVLAEHKLSIDVVQKRWEAYFLLMPESN